MPVVFFELTKSGLTNRNKLKKYLIKIGQQELTSFDNIHIILCSDEYLLNINRTYLQHDYYTDIITFDLTDSGIKRKSAEIYISVDRIRAHAFEYKTTIKNELHRVIFHGILHLCGYKDKTKVQQKTMRLKEDFYLTKYFKK